jgi:two-component system KDP operon response regulator KdpE
MRFGGQGKILESWRRRLYHKALDIGELVARIRAALKRSMVNSSFPPASVFTCGDLEIDFMARRVVLAGKEISLTQTEYNLLQELVLNAGKVVTYDYLLKKVWGPEYEREKEYIHTYVKCLRSKIERDPKNPRYIRSVRSVGYQFNNEPS